MAQAQADAVCTSVDEATETLKHQHRAPYSHTSHHITALTVITEGAIEASDTVASVAVDQVHARSIDARVALAFVDI